MTVFLGIKFDDHLNLNQAAEEIISSKKVFVVTPNVDHVVSYHESPDYHDSIQEATHVLCDSRVLSLLAKVFTKSRISNVVPGSDLTKKLVEQYPSKLGQVLLIGGEQGDDLYLTSRYSGLRIKQIIPPFGLRKNNKLREDVIKQAGMTKADTVLLAVGSPQQEMIAAMLWERNNEIRILCIGASVDFLTGRQRRAPMVFQRLHLEWFYRLCSDPKRLIKRYLYRDMKIFSLIFSLRK